jgi:hypothetical protein
MKCPRENKVVITTSIVVDVDADETGNSRRLELIAQRFQEAIDKTFKRSRSVKPTCCLAYDWLNEPNTNFGRCVRCERLVSDYQKPHHIRGLTEATVVDGALLCDECACFGREDSENNTARQ